MGSNDGNLSTFVDVARYITDALLLKANPDMNKSQDKQILKAHTKDSHILTDISFSSKKYWNYPEENFSVWEKELTITSDYINKNTVFKYCKSGDIIAFYSLVRLLKEFCFQGECLRQGWYLDHMFIKPSYIRKNIGTKLFHHLIEYCRENEVEEFGILSDPNAQGFYIKIGCNYIKEFPSNISGRTTPFLVCNI